MIPTTGCTGSRRPKTRCSGSPLRWGGSADGFHPDSSRILPLIEENLGPNLYVAFAAGYGIIAGTVTDSSTTLPIEGAIVVVEGTTLSDSTDIVGKYLIDGVLVSLTYNVIASAVGYLF
ncbi:MAG: carboxypeptidase regulatory-like domain-containing protein [bacterium]